jgi:hypothetical protein
MAVTWTDRPKANSEKMRSPLKDLPSDFTDIPNTAILDAVVDIIFQMFFA